MYTCWTSSVGQQPCAEVLSDCLQPAHACPGTWQCRTASRARGLPGGQVPRARAREPQVPPRATCVIEGVGWDDKQVGLPRVLRAHRPVAQQRVHEGVLRDVHLVHQRPVVRYGTGVQQPVHIGCQSAHVPAPVGRPRLAARGAGALSRAHAHVPTGRSFKGWTSRKGAILQTRVRDAVCCVWRTHAPHAPPA